MRVDGTVAVVDALRSRGEHHRRLHRRRADVVRAARRHDQERPARLAQRRAARPRRPVPHRLSRARPQSDSPRRCRRSRDWPRSNGTAGNDFSAHQSSRSRTSTPAPARTTSFPARLDLLFNFRFSTESSPERSEGSRARGARPSRPRVRPGVERLGRAVRHAAGSPRRRSDRGDCRPSPA